MKLGRGVDLGVMDGGAETADAMELKECDLKGTVKRCVA